MEEKHSFWAKWNFWYRKPKAKSVSLFTGSKDDIYLLVSKLVDQGSTIKSMAISQDFQAHGHERKFICIVYHEL